MKKSRAVFTMVYNEAIFLPIWLRYYSRFFPPEDIYVLDHESTDDSTSGSGFVRVPVPNPVVDCEQQLITVQRQQHDLITLYDVVLYTDVDEIVTPDPVSNLGDYINSFQYDYVNCQGLEILHLKDQEKPLDLAKSIMDQRSYWFHNDRFLSKPLWARIPMDWDLGCHARLDGQHREDSLYLIHLHRVDYDICLARHRQVAARPQSKKDLENGWGAQRRIVDDINFEKWFYESSGKLEVIPEVWKQLNL